MAQLQLSRIRSNQFTVNNNNTAIGHSRFPTDQFSTYLTSIYNSIFYGNTPKTMRLFSDISPSTGINSNDDSEKDIRRNIVQEYNLGTNNMIGVNPQILFKQAAMQTTLLQSGIPDQCYSFNRFEW